MIIIEYCPKCGKQVFETSLYEGKKVCKNYNCQYTEWSQTYLNKTEFNLKKQTEKNYKLIQSLNEILEKLQIDTFDFEMDMKGLDTFRRDLLKKVVKAINKNQEQRREKCL